MNYILIMFSGEVNFSDFDNNQIEEVKSYADFQKWIENKQIGLVVVSDIEIEIKGKFLPYDEILENKKEELEEYYPNMVTIFYQQEEQEKIEEIKQDIIEIKDEKNEIIKCENLYLIEYLNGKIRVFNYKQKLYLKFEGETKFKLENNFWEWFKDKTEYENEGLCFVIITDKDNFEIDSSIKIATQNSFNPDLSQYKNYNIIKFPKENKQEIKKEKKEKINTVKKQGELAEFMIKKLKG